MQTLQLNYINHSLEGKQFYLEVKFYADSELALRMFIIFWRICTSCIYFLSFRIPQIIFLTTFDLLSSSPLNLSLSLLSLSLSLSSSHYLYFSFFLSVTLFLPASTWLILAVTVDLLVFILLSPPMSLSFSSSVSLSVCLSITICVLSTMYFHVPVYCIPC